MFYMGVKNVDQKSPKFKKSWNVKNFRQNLFFQKVIFDKMAFERVNK